MTTVDVVGRWGGYTLLEILVVLVLIGSIAGLVLPRLDRLYGSTLYAFQREELLRQIEGLCNQALEQGATIVFGGGGDDGADVIPPPFAVPEGWQLRSELPIRYLANGVCLGGVITLSTGQRSERFHLAPPFCRAQAI